jgi:DNA helicase-2/ATP-dependent DNA helicase PcrA
MSTVSGVNPEDLLHGLTPAQREAVTATASPLCILAGAGSGKTSVLTRRVAWRAATGDLDPRHVLTLTFTRKAAGELSQRLRALGLREHVAAGTFHSVAYAQLRSRWEERGITPPTLLEKKFAFVARLMSSSTRVPSTIPPIDVIAEIEWAKARMIDPEHYAEAAERAGRRPPASPSIIAEVYSRYESKRREQRFVDFDDLLRVCQRDLLADPEFAETQRWRFQHLFVDEFQDVNPLQQALLDAWRGERLDLCVVGDPNQAIYSWNGADPDLLRRFPTRFPTAQVIRLTDNFRSAPQILGVSNALLATGGDAVDRGGLLRATRPDGPVPRVIAFADDRTEAAGIARSVRDHHGPGARWSAQAVLVRTNAQIPAIEEALTAARIPFRVRGAAPLLEQPEIKAALAQLRNAGGSLSDALADLASALDDTAADTTEEGDRAAERRANVDALVQMGRDYLAVEAGPTVAGFMAWLASTTRADQPDRNGDAVELCTFHAAKGLEWPVVHVAGLEVGLAPIVHARTDEALDEELRLFYVAVTRAERELLCTWAQSRRYGSRTMSREPSPYLDIVSAACSAMNGGLDPEAVGRGAVLAGTDGSAARRTPRRTERHATRRGSRSSGGTAGVISGASDLDEQGRALLESLRAWRLARARAASTPAFVICNDRTLVEIADRRPSTSEELLSVHGFGEVKVARFGPELLAIINATSTADNGAGTTD